ncbi:MAG: RHS repeat-associated core domain-containing protein, partial [Pseudomonadota bacterium]
FRATLSEIGGGGAAMGMVFRASDNQHLYRFVTSASGGYRRLEKVSGTETTILATTGGALGYGEKGHYTVEADGPRMRVYHGPDSILQAEDASYLTGTVGFVADWDPYGRWDDVHATPLDSRGDACDPCPGTVDPACVPACDDTDGDGYGTTVGSCGKQQADCASTDPSIYLGAVEGCDGLDNDCDGRSDENCREELTTYSYDSLDQLRVVADSTGMTTFDFDENGNRIRKQAPNGVTEYSWDLDNRLSQVRLPNGVVNRMAYDTAGLRIRLEDSEGTHDILLNGTEELAEYRDLGRRSTLVHDPTAPDALVSRTSDVGHGYYLHDALGSIVGLSSSEAGVVVGQSNYDAFGNSEATGEMQGEQWKFTGRRWDHDLAPAGIGYFRARYYDSSVGSFISKDPVRTDGVSQWIYAMQSPVNFSDPGGEFPSDMFTTSVTLSSCITGLWRQKVVGADPYPNWVFKETLKRVFWQWNYTSLVPMPPGLEDSVSMRVTEMAREDDCAAFSSTTRQIKIPPEEYSACDQNHNNCQALMDSVVRESIHVIWHELMRQKKCVGQRMDLSGPYADFDWWIQDTSELMESLLFGVINCECRHQGPDPSGKESNSYGTMDQREGRAEGQCRLQRPDRQCGDF